AAGAAVPRGGAGARYALFVAPADGMAALIAALAQRLPEGIVRTGAAVAGLTHADGRWRLRAGDEPVEADAVILATPSYVAGEILSSVDPTLAGALGGIDY